MFFKHRCPQIKDNFTKLFAEVSFDMSDPSDMSNLKNEVFNIASNVLSFQNRKHQDWFDENSININELHPSKRDLIVNLHSSA